MTHKRQYHHGNLRQTLLDTAVQIVTEEGVDALTTKELSKRVGVSAPALYRHYKSRRDLLMAVFVLSASELVQRIEAARAAAPAPQDQPECVADAIIGYGDEYPHRYRLLNELELVAERDGETEAYRLHLAINGLIDEALRLADPGMDDKMLRERSLLMWFIIYGYVSVRNIQPHFSALDDPSASADLRRKLIRLAIGGA